MSFPIRTDYVSPFAQLMAKNVGLELYFHGMGTSCVLARSSTLPEYVQIEHYLTECLGVYESEDQCRRIERWEDGSWISPSEFLFRNKSVKIGMMQHGVKGYVQTWVRPTFTFALLSSDTHDVIADLNFLLRHSTI